MIEKYNINDYLKDDKELQKAVIQELLEEMKSTNIKNEKLQAENEELKYFLQENNVLKALLLLNWQKVNKINNRK